MTNLELRIPPALLVLITAALMAGLTFAMPSLRVTVPGRTSALIGFLALGASIAIAGVAEFRRRRTTVNPLDPGKSTSLVSTGIYRFSRNPMYLGFLLALVGWGIFLGSVLAVWLLPAFILYMNKYQIAPEERSLAKLFPTVFDAYAASVRRWI